MLQIYIYMDYKHYDKLPIRVRIVIAHVKHIVVALPDSVIKHLHSWSYSQIDPGITVPILLVRKIFVKYFVVACKWYIKTEKHNLSVWTLLFTQQKHNPYCNVSSLLRLFPFEIRNDNKNRIYLNCFYLNLYKLFIFLHFKHFPKLLTNLKWLS